MKKLLTPEGREAILATARLLKIEPQYCCDGRECGCFGMPINPEHYIVNDVLPEAMKLIGELQVEIRPRPSAPRSASGGTRLVDENRRLRAELTRCADSIGLYLMSRGWAPDRDALREAHGDARKALQGAR